jgi:hypothetical protein
MSDKHSRKRGPTCPLSQNLSQTNDLWAHFTRNLCGNVTGTGARKIYLTYAVALKPAIGGKLEEDRVLSLLNLLFECIHRLCVANSKAFLTLRGVGGCPGPDPCTHKRSSVSCKLQIATRAHG